MAFPFKSEGFWGPLFRRRDRARISVEAPRAARPSKRQLVLHLKKKADRIFNRDRLIFDPLEPRVLLDGTSSYLITAPIDSGTQEHQVLVQLVDTSAAMAASADKVQQVQIFDYTGGTKGQKLHSFGDISDSNKAFTLTGTSGKDRITVDADSFNLLTGSQTPLLTIADATAGDGDTIALLNKPTGAARSGAEFTLTGTDAGTIASGKFAGSFSGIGNLTGAAAADDKLTIGSGASLSGTFDGGKGSLQLDLSSALTGSIDATLSSAAFGKYTLAKTSGSSAADFSLAFTAPTTSLGVILGSGDDTLHLASLPPAPNFTVSGGAGADRIVFDTDLSATSGDLALTFDGGAGDDRIDIAANLSTVAGKIGITFQGGAGDNSLTVAQGKTITASGSVRIAADATLTPVLTTDNNYGRSADAKARMGVTVNKDAVISGVGVAIAVTSSVTVADTAPADTQTLTVTADGLAGITLAGRIDARTGAAALTTDVVDSITLTSTLTSQLKRVTPTLTNSSTIVVGASGAVNGGTVKLAANTRATVDVKAIGLVLPSATTFTNAASGTADTIKAVVKGEKNLSDVFTPAELAVEGIIKRAETTITNTTQVTVAAGAQIVQTGAATISGSDPAVSVQISADDRTNATTTLVAKDGTDIPVLSSLLNLFALTANQNVTRVTSVDLGVPATGTPPTGAPTADATALISAAGNAAIQASNSGALQVRIRAATEAPDPLYPTTKTVAGDGEDDGSLPAPIKAGAAQITVNDTVRVAVRGVRIAAASLAVAATNDTGIESRAVQARNLLTGSTSAIVEASRLSASTGAVSVVAMDATKASAIAVPIETGTLEAETDTQKANRELIGIARGSAVNTTERDITAAFTDSELSAATDVTLTAQNALDLTTEAKAAVASSKLGVAGSYAVNIVLGSTTATVLRGSVIATAGDVTVNAADVTNIDSRAQTTVEGAASSGGAAVGSTASGNNAIGGAAAFNIVGYRADGVTGTDKLADKIVGMALDTVLGTGFFTVAATQSIRARVDAAIVTASAGRVGLNAASAGTVNATVSNTVTTRTPEQTRADLAKAEARQSALNEARRVLGKPAVGGNAGTVTTAASRSIGGLIATNRIARSATADVVSGATITSAGELGVRAADMSTINANVKLVASSQAASDGGLSGKQPQIKSDFKANAGQPVEITLGQRVAVDFANALGIDPIRTVSTTDAIKSKLPATTKDAKSGATGTTATPRFIKTGDVVLVSPGQPAGKGEVGSYYRYIKATGTQAVPATQDSIDLSKADFTDATLWKLVGEKGAVYAYMGPDSTATTKLDLKTADFTNRDLWRSVGDGEAAAAKTTGSAGMSAGGIVVRNEIKGGVVAAISGSATRVNAGSVAVAAERSATITSKADATVEAIATIREQTGEKADGTADTAGTASDVPGKTSAFDKAAPATQSGQGNTANQSRSSALAINAVIATNTIQSAADASITDAAVTTTGSDGSVAVTAKTAGVIEAEVEAAITAATSGPSGSEGATTTTGSGQAKPPTTSARAAGIQLAFNAIGYESGNLGFDTLDAVVGTNLTNPATAQASARISNSTVTATGAISATAESSGAITSKLSNEVTASAAAASVNALAVSGLVAMNRVSGAAQAQIDANGKTVSGTDVTVSAVDSVSIDAETAVAATATAEKTGDVGGVSKGAEALLGEYTYTTASGTRQVKFGEKIRLSDTWAGAATRGEKGAVYQYMGTDFAAAVDLGSTTDANLNFADFALWKKLDATNVVSDTTTGGAAPTGKMSATGLGGIFARNDVSGKAEAKIVNTTLKASGDVAVSADSTASITAADESEVEAEGGAAANGVLVSNNVQNGALAFIKDSTVTSSGGGVSVSAVNSSSIEASAAGSVSGEGTALGFTLAFNTVGFKQQNPLFAAVDTIVGDPLIATATNSENPAGAKAYITGSTVTAEQDVTVKAESRASIKAEAGNKVKQADSEETVHKAETGARGISAGAVLAMNKVSGRAEAFIGSETVSDQAPTQLAATVTSTAGSVLVSAKNQAGIESESTMIGSSSVSGGVAELAKKAVATALNIYDYTSKSGTRDLTAGDRVRLAADFTPAGADSSTDAKRAEEPLLAGRVFIFVGSAAKGVVLASEDYSNTARWFAVDDGATVSTKPSAAGTTATTDTTTGDTADKDTTTVKTAEGTTTITRTKARYTSNAPSYQDMIAGQGVLLSRTDTVSKGEKGTIYIWRGADNTWVTLHGEDYTSDNWIPAAAKTVMPQIDKVADPAPAATPAQGAPTPTNRTPASSSKAFGGLIVFNEVNGGSTARITDATVTSALDLSVRAEDAADISATLVSTVTSSGGASFKSQSGAGTSGGTGGGTLIAANGIAATNVVRGGAEASVLRSAVEAQTGNLDVTAENTAGVDARVRASSTTSGGEGGGVSGAVTLAFNSVGYQTQNLLFNAVDTLIGQSAISGAFGGEVGSGAKATIVKSSAKAGGDLTVSATSAAKINATISNAAMSSTDSMKGSGGSGFGVVLSSNKVSGSATALIDNTGVTKDITAGGALAVTAKDAAGITSNVQIVTSSTVVKTDGGAVTNQSKLNKYLPSDFSTNPNEVQSATIQSNIIKNRKDFLPAELTALEEKASAEIARVKGLILELQARPTELLKQVETATLKLKAGDSVDAYLRTINKTLVDALKAVVDAKVIPTTEQTDLARRLTKASDDLKPFTAVGFLNTPAADEARTEALKLAAEAARRGYLDDAALRNSTNADATTKAAEKTVGSVIGLQVAADRAVIGVAARIVELKDGLNAFLKPFGLSTDSIGTLDLSAFGQAPKTVNKQDVTFGTRVRIAEGYAKPTFKAVDSASVTVKTGDTIQDFDGKIYKYVGAELLSKVQPSTFVLTDTTKFSLIAAKSDAYKAGDIYIYMGTNAPQLDLAATDYSNKLLWKRALESNFIPDGLTLPSTGSTPAAAPAATPATTTETPTGDPSAGNAAQTGTVKPQSAAALAIGGLVVLNSVHGDAIARITGVTATTGTGAITVSATETATITATADSAANVKSASSYRQTNGTAAAGSTPAPSAATTDPTAGTKSQTKSLALGGIIATNAVLGTAKAEIVDSTVTGGGGVSVGAVNTATIDATNKVATSSDQGAVSITLAFNTIGWKEQNILFRTADLITGQPLIGAGNDDTPSGASAQILRSTVVTGAGSTLGVSARSDATINAQVNNKASASNAVLKDASAYAIGFALTGNMVNAKALATIDNTGTTKTVDAGGAVTISATSNGSIVSLNSLSSLASLTKPSVLEDFANKVLDNYTYTTKSGTKTVKFGDIVFAKINGVEKRFVYFGETKSVDLTATGIFTEANSWRENNLREFIKFLPPGVLNLGESKDASASSTPPAEGAQPASGGTSSKPYAVAVAGILVSNDVQSTATASLVNTGVVRAGDVSVQAAQTGTITATITSKVESKLKAGTKPGDKSALAIGAVIAANVVTGTSSATIAGSKLGDVDSGKTVGNVAVGASNTAAITATVDSTVESSETAVGVTAAFNKIGTSSQNVLFDLSDAILGTDLGTVLQGANTFAATASITGQPINATGAVSVTAQSKATIKAEIKNAVTTVGASVTSVGAVVSLNLARLATSATIADVTNLNAARGVSVSALSASAIDAVVTAPVTSVAYKLPPTDPAAGNSGSGNTGSTSQTGKTIAVALSIARNTIVDETLTAGIDRVGQLTATAGDVRVSASSDATIVAKATATAIAVLLSTEDGKNIGFAGGGALGFNTILGGVDAHLAGSKITAGGTVAPAQDGTGGQGNITVAATNDSAITASVEAAAAAVVVGKGTSQA
ncbi:beta strand repeat-containing protein, partial [Methylobacterium haplocladii]